jgi:hypothetical protein
VGPGKVVQQGDAEHQRHDDGFMSEVAFDADLGEPVDECCQCR